MDFFALPPSTKIERVVPKNTFDAYFKGKAKKELTDYVKRISWVHKLAFDTINLRGKDLEEIQVFRVELKQKQEIRRILELFQKAIPYQAIFWVEYQTEAYLSTAAKHPHPTQADQAVVDWTFESEWFALDKCPYKLELRGSLDQVFKNFCLQLSGTERLHNQPLAYVVGYHQKVAGLKNEILRIKAAMKKASAFKDKVALNLELQKKEEELNTVRNGG